MTYPTTRLREQVPGRWLQRTRSGRCARRSRSRRSDTASWVREMNMSAQAHWDRPWNVQVVRREEDAVRHPVATPESAVHPRQEEPTKRSPRRGPVLKTQSTTMTRTSPSSRSGSSDRRPTPERGRGHGLRRRRRRRNPAAANATVNGITTSQTLPPRGRCAGSEANGARALRGESTTGGSLAPAHEGDDEHELPDQADREETVSAFTMGRLPSPESWSATAGATSHASAAIGRAAAAQTARIARRRYCGISTLETAASLGPGLDASVNGGRCPAGRSFAGRGHSSWRGSSARKWRGVVRNMTVLLLAGV